MPGHRIEVSQVNVSNSPALQAGLDADLAALGSSRYLLIVDADIDVGTFGHIDELSDQPGMTSTTSATNAHQLFVK